MTDLTDDLAALRIERSPERPRRRWVRWTIALLVLAGGGVGAWRWVTRGRPVEVVLVAATERAAGVQASVLNASGYVTARRRATVSSKITGKVVEVNVEEGMAVKEAQVLARLDDSSFKAALELAEAQAEAARRAVRENEVRLVEATLTLGRVLHLVKEKLTTAAELDRARAEVDSLDARIAAARAQVRVAERQIEINRTNLDDATIRAPFSGVAISKDAQPGEMVSPISAGGGFTRTGICTIVDMRSLEIEVDVNENYINRVSEKQKVSAVLNAYPEWQIPAHVITTVPTAHREKATVLVRIGFEQLDPRILPDMGVKVTFLRDENRGSNGAMPGGSRVALVPKTTIRTEGEQTYVFVVKSGVADRRAVKVLGTDGDRIEIIAGLTAGERVVLSPPPSLATGTVVVVR